jgi:hypothetical protein
MVISSFMTYRRACSKSNMTGATSGEGTAYPSPQTFFVIQLLITRFFSKPFMLWMTIVLLWVIPKKTYSLSVYQIKRFSCRYCSLCKWRCAAYSDLIYCYKLCPDTNVYSIEAYPTPLVLLYVNYYAYV